MGGDLMLRFTEAAVFLKIKNHQRIYSFKIASNRAAALSHAAAPIRREA